MTSLEPITPDFVDRDIPDTEVIAVPSPAPVFVDSTGRRRRVLRRLAYAFGGLCMVYGGLVSVSLAGGPVSSSAVLPLPDLRGSDEVAADAKPTPIPAPSTSAPPQSRFITEALRRPVSTVRDERPRAPRPAAATPARTPTPRPTTKSPTPKPTPTRPVESTTTDPVEEPTKSESPSTDPTAPAPEPPVDEPPVPPAPPQSGGTGGGSETAGSGGGTTSGGGTGSPSGGSGSSGSSGSGSGAGGSGQVAAPGAEDAAGSGA